MDKQGTEESRSSSKPAVSYSTREVARTIATAFKTEKPAVYNYYDDNRQSRLAVAQCRDRPQQGLTSYATLGLSDFPLFKGREEYQARLELVGACSSSCESFGNIVATAGFCVINSKWFCAPGTIFPNLVSMYCLSSTMRHCMFVSPFIWEEELRTLYLPDKTIAWLLLVPISEAEYQFAESKGSRQLELALEMKQIDMFDIERPSIF
jgi:antitoxin YqcF